MAFTKITSEDTANKGVVGLADTPNLSTQEMQKKFDELATDVIIPKFNKLSDELDSKSIDKKVSSEEITNIRINEDKQLETSNDGGVTWEATASSGHIIENGASTQYPARARLQFSDNVVISDNPQQNKTFISVPAGEKGEKGESATITIGNVESGDKAQVENVGSDTDAIFNFTFPRGEHGSAATIRIGSVQSGQNASVFNSGTTSDAVFNFVLPKGDKGDTGTSFQIKGMYATYEELIAAHPTGSRGDAYAVGTSAENVIYNWNNDTKAWDNLGGLKGAKGDTGESATITVGTVTKGETTNVENVGTSEHAIFNFTLEQGAKGEKGDSATVSVGSVEQGNYPEVINVGTPQNAILNFKLQKGEKGEQGNPTVVNGKNGVNINLYATDIDMSDKEATKVSEKISNVSTSVNTLSNKVTTLEADVVKNTSVLTLEEINAGTEAELADKVPNANALKKVNNSIGDISGFTNTTYDSIGDFIQYCVDNGYLPDVNSLPLIPAMTSATAPSGEASASGYSNNKPAYYAFDNKDDTNWLTAVNTVASSTWLQYKFASAKSAKKAVIKACVAQMTCVVKIQGSNDGTNWKDISNNVEFEQTTTTSATYITKEFTIKINDSTAYKYFRLQFVSSSTQYIANNAYQQCSIVSMQLYG